MKWFHVNVDEVLLSVGKSLDGASYLHKYVLPGSSKKIATRNKSIFYVLSADLQQTFFQTVLSQYFQQSLVTKFY